MKVRYCKYVLNFKQPSGTSRGVLRQKETFFIEMSEGKRYGIGECGLFRGLSVDDVPHFEEQLAKVCSALERGIDVSPLYTDFPSIRIGVEMALKSFASDDSFQLYETPFSKGAQPISINGLVWMGTIAFMRQQVFDKIEAGYDCIKLKIGALDFDVECQLLAEIRRRYSPEAVTLRVDANGAFRPEEALQKLEKLSQYGLHSIEQPIAAGQVKAMQKLCAQTPIPIALDEELIGVLDATEQAALLDEIRPQYIILKPSLLGGFFASEDWIKLAEARNIGRWITSALESNIGLNAIAQWTATQNTVMPQGLGTGGLFTNNFQSPLVVDKGVLLYDNALEWDIKNIN
ncbi:MAG: o-succinylbenzoate synthase [Flavobacteriaceae bacterium]|jgi:o-succinylbenzoate synthase|nr:o-succinylbenzoate synthase [Flavobacteriaceae bacterium]